MRKIGLYIRLVWLFTASLWLPTASLTPKIDKLLAELKGETPTAGSQDA